MENIMKKLFLTITLFISGLANAAQLGRSDITLINKDNQTHEVHGLAGNVRWKFNIRGGETISELLPIPQDAQHLTLPGQKPVALDSKFLVIEGNELKPAQLSTEADAKADAAE
jgi:hypothetical protein